MNHHRHNYSWAYILLIQFCLVANVAVFAEDRKPKPGSKSSKQPNVNKIDVLDSKGFTALHRAVRKFTNLDQVQSLLKQGANIEAKVVRLGKLNSDTALMIAALYRDVRTVKLLLKYGANVNYANKYGQTALQAAAYQWDYHTVKLLLKHGAKINQTDKSGRSALFWAMAQQQVEIIKLLLRNKVNVNIKVKEQLEDPGTFLHYACTKSPYFVYLLLKHGAKIESTTAKLKLTPLHLAASNGNVEAVSLLLANGANRGAKDNSNFTALDLAKKSNHNNVIRLLEAYSKPSPDSKKIISDYKEQVLKSIKLAQDKSKKDSKILQEQSINIELIDKAYYAKTKKEAINFYIQLLQREPTPRIRNSTIDFKYYRNQAAKKLIRLEYTKYKHLFKTFASHKSAMLRRVAIGAFDRAKDKSTASLLRKISTNDPDAVNRSWAKEVLEKLLKKAPLS